MGTWLGEEGHLLCRPEDLSLNSREKSSIAAFACNPSIRELEQVDPKSSLASQPH